ncbi:hypothetical protein HK101_005764 [Irineochytrium annulatum]|nr:hypothetical protein HK101_005764 [Irineochytrium annulatum]
MKPPVPVVSPMRRGGDSPPSLPNLPSTATGPTTSVATFAPLPDSQSISLWLLFLIIFLCIFVVCVVVAIFVHRYHKRKEAEADKEEMGFSEKVNAWSIAAASADGRVAPEDSSASSAGVGSLDRQSANQGLLGKNSVYSDASASTARHLPRRERSPRRSGTHRHQRAATGPPRPPSPAFGPGPVVDSGIRRAMMAREQRLTAATAAAVARPVPSAIPDPSAFVAPPALEREARGEGDADRRRLEMAAAMAQVKPVPAAVLTATKIVGASKGEYSAAPKRDTFAAAFGELRIAGFDEDDDPLKKPVGTVKSTPADVSVAIQDEDESPFKTPPRTNQPASKYPIRGASRNTFISMSSVTDARTAASGANVGAAVTDLGVTSSSPLSPSPNALSAPWDIFADPDEISSITKNSAMDGIAQVMKESKEGGDDASREQKGGDLIAEMKREVEQARRVRASMV